MSGDENQIKMKKSKRKALGQHFLVDRMVLKKIANTIDPQQEDFIIEIGAGKGALTFFLAKKANKVIAIEKDKSLIPVLKSKNLPNLTVLEKDVLKLEFKEFTRREKVKLVGNLPYSISSPILFKVLAEKDLFSECTFLLQKEVADRICSQPGSKNYAPVSILFQNHFLIKLHFNVSPASFSPPPKVKSSLISLRKREAPLFSIKNEELFLEFLRGAFRHRRKKLSNNLKKLNLSDSLVKDALQKCKIDEGLRPEQVSISKFVALYNHLTATLSLSEFV